MRWIKAIGVGLAVFAPFIMVGYALAILPNTWEVITNLSPYDWTWLTMLGLMMVAMYYFLAVYLEDEEEIELEFKQLDKDHDGYISRDQVLTSDRYRRDFNESDADHDGKLSRVEFEAYEHSISH
jgi:hypothetical protein